MFPTFNFSSDDINVLRILPVPMGGAYFNILTDLFILTSYKGCTFLIRNSGQAQY